MRSHHSDSSVDTFGSSTSVAGEDFSSLLQSPYEPYEPVGAEGVGGVSDWFVFRIVRSHSHLISSSTGNR